MPTPNSDSRVRAQLKSAVIVAGAMITGWVIAWMTLDFGPEPRPVDVPVDVASAAEIDEVERELAQLRRELAAAAAEPGTVRALDREWVREPAPVPGSGEQPEPPELLERDPDTLSPPEFEQWRAAELARIEQVFDGFDERLANEPRDHDWSPKAEAEIGHTLAELREQQGFATTTLLTSECGSSTCRAEFDHVDPDEQRQFMQALGTHTGAEFEQTDIRIYTEPDGSLRTEAYFTRRDGLT